MNFSRRELLSLGLPAAAGAMLPASAALAAPPATQPDLMTGWPERRKDIERRWLALLGDFPKTIPTLLPAMKEVVREDGVTRYHVKFRAEEDDWVTGWLLVPDAARKEPSPAIVCLHSTTWGTGKDSTIGLAGIIPGDPPEGWSKRYRNPDIGQAYGYDLARHGYVTLSIDLLSDGERILPGARIMDTRPFYEKHPDWSMVGKNTWDIMRSVDFLQTLDFVDGKRIGCIGWSLGGHSSVFAAAFDPRIGVTESIGGVFDWHRKSNAWARPDDMQNSPELERRFGFKPNSGPYIYIKKFRPYLADQSLPLPVDFDELMMLVAPRPLLLLSTEFEFSSHKLPPKCVKVAELYAAWRDTPDLPSVVGGRQERGGYDLTLDYYNFHNKISPERMTQIFGDLGAVDCFSWFSYPGGHGLPRAARWTSYAWFDRWFGFHPPENSLPT